MWDNTRVDSQEQVKRLLELQSMLYHLADIERLIYLPDGLKTDRRENDTEHSYHLAMLAWYLSGLYPNLDQSLVIRLALVHDVVEVYAGDSMAIGRTEEQQAEKDAREKAAFERLKQEWPDFPAMLEAIESYETLNSPEARFVKALDKITPIIHQIHSKGKTWRKWDMQRSSVVANKDKKTQVSPEIHKIWKLLRAEMYQHDEWFNDGKAD